MKKILAIGLALAALALAPVRATDATWTSGDVLLGIRNPGGGGDRSAADLRLPMITEWQDDKINAIAQLYRPTPVRQSQRTTLIAELENIWANGSVPMLSLEPHASNALIATGLTDLMVIDPFAAAIKQWLRGADGVYNTGDDKRLYLRPAWEANGSWYPWAPCNASGGTPEEYKQMWRRLHSRFTQTAGIHATRLQWVFSVNQNDVEPQGETCSMEELYPGDAYVDWVGIDGYQRSHSMTPEAVFRDMYTRLQDTAPGKPMSINETGVSDTGWANGGAVAKATFITDYFAWIHDNDVRMSLWFNIDTVEGGHSAVLCGGAEPPETTTVSFGSYECNAWEEYRVGAVDPRMIGSTGTGRLITDDQFRGA